MSGLTLTVEAEDRQGRIGKGRGSEVASSQMLQLAQEDRLQMFNEAITYFMLGLIDVEEATLRVPNAIDNRRRCN